MDWLLRVAFWITF